MKVIKSEYVLSAVKPAQYPDDALPEFALAGRSNVGKSSLINCMLQRKNLARTSSKPGKTQTINFYRINDLFYFADVPGYGFAKVPKSVRNSWQKMMETYFTKRETLRGMIQLVDIRHAPSREDQQMYQFLRYLELPIMVVATKVDKISRNKWNKHAKIVKDTLQMSKEHPLILFSSTTKMGRDELWQRLEALLEDTD
ncbi:GTP-binding protein [Seinonella peptonophila]|uniref:Probable GTP-binding protein EngB n=1 Tax=Seinonella peptonophila TaxID=112248 RepID=A0A1M4TV40_9BACL|nr:ribosome biogenesis GTP-binding protein YihA/YsxC [Seinonella peptonophila]SHE48293.1 GTP-binding protein [Seinonella peptonophila]